jgi:hypothetical protein
MRDYDLLHRHAVKAILTEYLPDPGEPEGTFMGIPLSEFDKEDLLGIVYFMQRQHDLDVASRARDFDLLIR